MKCETAASAASSSSSAAAGVKSSARSGAPRFTLESASEEGEAEIETESESESEALDDGDCNPKLCENGGQCKPLKGSEFAIEQAFSDSTNNNSID